MAAIKKIPPKKAPELDGIPNYIIQRAGNTAAIKIADILKALLKIGHYPEELKNSNTIVLRKPGKSDYITAKVYRPIALLSTVGKVIKSVIARKLGYIADEKGLLPHTHIGERRKTLVKTAVLLITEKTIEV